MAPVETARPCPLGAHFAVSAAFCLVSSFFCHLLWIRYGRSNGDAAHDGCFEEVHALLRRLVGHMLSLYYIFRLCNSKCVCMFSVKMNENLLEFTSDLFSFLMRSEAIPPHPCLIIAWCVAPNVLHNRSIKPYPKPCLF